MEKREKNKLILTVFVFLFLSVSVFFALDGGKETYSVETTPSDSKFDDINFYNCVKGIVKPSDIDSKGIISTSALQGIKKLECEGKNITSVKGIEYMTGLTFVNLLSNKMEILDFSKNTLIETLWIARNENLKHLNYQYFLYNQTALYYFHHS